jgi:hypothetical protein
VKDYQITVTLDGLDVAVTGVLSGRRQMFERFFVERFCREIGGCQPRGLRFTYDVTPEFTVAGKRKFVVQK